MPKEKEKIEKLNINLLPEEDKAEYEKEKAEFIAEYEVLVESTRQYIEGGFFSSGYYIGEHAHYIKDPIQGQVEWNRKYPNGFNDYKQNHRTLTSIGEQNVINKVNELVDAYNKLVK